MLFIRFCYSLYKILLFSLVSLCISCACQKRLIHTLKKPIYTQKRQKKRISRACLLQSLRISMRVPSSCRNLPLRHNRKLFTHKRTNMKNLCGSPLRTHTHKSLLTHERNQCRHKRNLFRYKRNLFTHKRD